MQSEMEHSPSPEGEVLTELHTEEDLLLADEEKVNGGFGDGEENFLSRSRSDLPPSPPTYERFR